MQALKQPSNLNKIVADHFGFDKVILSILKSYTERAPAATNLVMDQLSKF